MRDSCAIGFLVSAACATVGCSVTGVGDSCGPGSVLVGTVCTVAPLDGASSGEAEGGSPFDTGAAGDSTQGGGAEDATPDAIVSDVTSVVDATATDAATQGAGDASDAGADVETFDAADAGTDAQILDASDASADVESGDASDAGAFAFAAPNCSVDAGTPATSFIPLDGGLREILIDPCNTHVYVTNESANRVEDYSVAAGALATPIAVGSAPNGFDVTPDGQRLYVANTGGTNVSVVDLASREELKMISFTSDFSSDTAYSLAIASNGIVFFSTTFAGSGFGARMMSFDVTSEAVTERTDFYINGTTTEVTSLKSNASHEVLGVVAGDISSGPVFIYQSASDKFSKEHDLNGFISRVAVSADGSLLLVNGAMVLDSSSNLLGTTENATTPFGAFGPSAAVAYRSNTHGIDVLDTTHFLVQSTISVNADTMTSGGLSVGNMAVSSDGKWIAVITDHGLVIVDVP